MIAAHKTSISARAIPGDLSPKNRTDHRALSTSWPPNKARGNAVVDVLPARHTSHPAKAIARYSAVQTGPNSQLGGVKKGLARLSYHSGMEDAVNADPTRAAPKHAATKPTSASTERAGAPQSSRGVA